jgi:small multidrug resistance pump
LDAVSYHTEKREVRDMRGYRPYPDPRWEDPRLSVLYLATAIVLEICGTTFLKLSEGFTHIGPTGAVVLCYTASFAFLSLALRGIDLSVAYAVWSGVGTAIVAAIGIKCFGESAGTWKLLSLALIVSGVAGLHLSQRGS